MAQKITHITETPKSQPSHIRSLQGKSPKRKLKRRISSFDPDINWESIKGNDEEN